MAPRNADKKRVAAFANALRDRLADSGMTQAELGSRLKGMSQTTVSHWVAGNRVPSPMQVFEIERALRLEPGDLSRHLGFLPNSAVPTMTVEEAVSSDPKLNSQQRRGLVAVYRAWSES